MTGDQRRTPVGSEPTEMTRSEEELRVGTHDEAAGRIAASKTVEHRHVEQVVSRDAEHADVERSGPADADSGQVETLPDGSISIPLFEEQLVVEKRLVVRERIIIRKYRTSEEQVVEADLRRENLEVNVSPEIADRVHPHGTG